MITAFYSTVLDHSIDRVWSLVRDFNNYPRYIDGVSESMIEDDRRGDEVGAVARAGEGDVLGVDEPGAQFERVVGGLQAQSGTLVPEVNAMSVRFSRRGGHRPGTRVARHRSRCYCAHCHGLGCGGWCRWCR